MVESNGKDAKQTMEDDLLEDDEDMIFTKAREFLQLVKGTTTKSNAQLLFTDGVKSLRPNFEKPSNEVNKQADDDRVDNRFIKTNKKNLVQFGGSFKTVLSV